MKFYLDPSFDPTKITPIRATSGSCGYDLAAAITEPVHIPYGKYVDIHTGVKISCPEGVAALLIPRSSSSKTNIVLANTVGLIDTDYRGYIICRLSCRYPDVTAVVNPGERIAQLVLVLQPDLSIRQVQSESQLGYTVRNDGGFGHTGR